MIPFLISDTMISGDWVLGLVKVLIGGLVGGGSVWWGVNRKNGKQKVSLEEPTKVQTERVYSPPTFWQHRSLERRVALVESRQDKAEQESRENFMKLMEAGEQRQNRLMDKMDEMKSELNQRLDARMKGSKSDA